MMMSHFGLTQLFFFAAATTAIGAMEVKYSWVYVDYLFDSQQDRELAIKSGKFIQENCVILDVDVFEGTACHNNNITTEIITFVTQTRARTQYMHSGRALNMYLEV
jgi:hypothetical protein